MKIILKNNSQLDTIIKFITLESSNSIKDFNGEKNSTTVRYNDNKTFIYSGLGNEKTITAQILRSAAANVVKKAIQLNRTKVAIECPNLKISDIGVSIAEGSFLGVYTFNKYISKKKTSLSVIELVGSNLNNSKLKKINIISEAVNYTRDLVNDNAEKINPAFLADEAKKISNINPAIKCTILDHKEIKKKGLGLLKAVGQGSSNPPRLIILQYKSKNTKKTSRHIGLSGKGITFDSGGLNLKKTGFIEALKNDMAGAAAVLGIFKALAKLNPAVNITAVIPIAHNSIGSKSYLPGDIYQSYAGKTVEIKNTDAEGRLILADAITYLQKHFKPTEIIDLATLTDTCVFALGDTCAGIFSNNNPLAEALIASGNNCGELLWRLPMLDIYDEAIQGDISDLKNMSGLPPNHAGAITAAAFIKAFIKNNTPWAHIDIAGPAFNIGESRGEIPKYATGFGVRLFIDYISRNCKL